MYCTFWFSFCKNLFSPFLITSHFDYSFLNNAVCEEMVNAGPNLCLLLSIVDTHWYFTLIKTGLITLLSLVLSDIFPFPWLGQFEYDAGVT